MKPVNVISHNTMPTMNSDIFLWQKEDPKNAAVYETEWRFNIAGETVWMNFLL